MVNQTNLISVGQDFLIVMHHLQVIQDFVLAVAIFNMNVIS
jgi:hypothetical protein